MNRVTRSDSETCPQPTKVIRAAVIGFAMDASRSTASVFLVMAKSSFEDSGSFSTKSSLGGNLLPCLA
jgi:hypothetical protein